MENKIIELLEEICEVESGLITVHTVLDDLEAWDSMAKLSLIVVMSDEFNKKLTSNDIKKFVKVQDIIDFALA